MLLLCLLALHIPFHTPTIGAAGGLAIAGIGCKNEVERVREGD